MKAFILAAGFGTRFRPATDRVPKALLPFLNEPILDRRLRALASAGFREVVVNGHHLAEQLADHLGKARRQGTELQFCREAPQILGTAGALRNARAFLEQGDFLVWNCDAELEPDFARLIEHHRASGAAATLLIAPNPDPRRYTPLYTEGGRLLRFGGEAGEPFLFTGVSVLTPKLLDRIGPGQRSLVSDLWEPLLEEGSETIAVVSHRGPFFDLSSPADLLEASLTALSQGGPFGPGAGRFDRQRRVLSLAPAVPAHDVTECVLPEGALPDPLRLRQSVVWPEAILEAGVEAERCLVGGGRLPAGGWRDAFLWAPDRTSEARAYPLRPR